MACIIPEGVYIDLTLHLYIGGVNNNIIISMSTVWQE